MRHSACEVVLVVVLVVLHLMTQALLPWKEQQPKLYQQHAASVQPAVCGHVLD